MRSRGTLYAVLFGLDRCMFGGLFPMPFDGGTLTPAAAGCTVLADGLIVVSGVAGPSPGTVPFPIVGGTWLNGLRFYAQAATVDLSTSALSASNGFAIGIGF